MALCFVLLLFSKESKQWLESRDDDNRSEVRKFFKSKLTMLVTTKLVFMWITTNALFYGLTLNSVLLEVSTSTSLIIFGAMDTAACLVLMMFSAKMQRKYSVAGTFALSGLADYIRHHVVR